MKNVGAFKLAHPANSFQSCAVVKYFVSPQFSNLSACKIQLLWIPRYRNKVTALLFRNSMNYRQYKMAARDHLIYRWCLAVYLFPWALFFYPRIKQGWILGEVEQTHYKS